MPATRPSHLSALTGLRFFVALWVVVHHGTVWWRPGLVPGRLGVLMDQGPLAVYLFFVLSGVVLTYSYALPSGGLRGPVREYYVARFARIYPVYALGLLLSVIPFMRWHGDVPAAFCGAHGQAALVAGSVALTQSWTSTGFCIDPPGWSLSVEAAFYLTFPVLALVIGRLPIRWALLGLVGCCLLYALAGHAPLTWDPSGSLFYFPVFMAGMVLGRVLSVAPSVPQLAGWIVPPVCVLAIVWLGSHPDGTVPQQAVYMLPIYLLLLWSLTGAVGLGRVLGHRVLVALGEASYGLYILHWPLLEWFSHTLRREYGIPAAADRAALPLFALFLVFAICSSLLCYRYVETPARLWIRRWLGASAPQGRRIADASRPLDVVVSKA